MAWVLLVGLLAGLFGVQAGASPAGAAPTPASACPTGTEARALALPSGASETLCYAPDGAGELAGDGPSLTLSKTVGTDPASCAPDQQISVAPSTEVFYCYTIANNGAVTFTAHSLEDDKLGPLFTNVAAVVGPGATAFYTASATIGVDTVNIATWTATDGITPVAAVDSATVMVADVPTAPTITSASAQEGQATVTWDPPASDGGSALTGYTVTPYAGAVAGTPVEAGPGEHSAVLTGLQNGTTHTIRVTATNGNGTGTASPPSALVTPQWWLPWSSGSVAVTEIYTWLTSVAPTASQKSSWLSQLNAGIALPGDLVAALRVGADAITNVDPTVRLYSAYLTRIPDANGLNFWLKRRRAGWTLSRISSSFAASSEFIRRYGHLSNRAFVEQIYLNVLGRTGDAAGITYWTRQLDAKKKSRGQVMINFSESNEYKTKQVTKVHAAALYIHFLGKTPTTLERDAVVADLVGGASVADVTRDFIHEASFATRAG